MILTDTHTHLFDAQFDTDRNYMVQRAINRGVKYMLMPNVDMNTIDGMLETAAAFKENCFPMIPSGKAHNEMILPDFTGQIGDVIDAKGKQLV